MLTPEKLLERSDSTAQVLVHARLLARLQQRFREFAPAGLAECARVVNYRLGTVVIHASNGATAAKLKQISPRMRENFEKSGLECNQIEVKVQPTSAPEEFPPGTQKPISEASAEILSCHADSLPEGSSLASALRKLVSRALIRK